jgi:hypothetical protein
LIVYFGDLSSINYSVECQKLYETLIPDEHDKAEKALLRKTVKEEGIVEVYKKVVIEDEVKMPEF